VRRTRLGWAQLATWCHQHDLHLFEVRRSGIECFGTDLKTTGRARSVVESLGATACVSAYSTSCSTRVKVPAPFRGSCVVVKAGGTATRAWRNPQHDLTVAA
jgi:hypothetical protein